ncbi:MAG: GNAT family N-acetyltransferase [Peptostreptococcus sp.]
MLEYRSLEETSIETLHKAFLNAFSDYEVNMDFSLEKFKNMLQRKSYLAKISMGVFDNGLLVGFVMNGFRVINGKTTAYDMGTGVVADYRRKGITSSMLLNIKKILKDEGIKQYLLEVIQTNNSAVELYKKEGFKVIRDLQCFKMKKKDYLYKDDCNINSYKIENVDKTEFKKFKTEELMAFWDFEPSWQNSMDSVKALADNFSYSFAFHDNKIVGYGIIDKNTGDIVQLAVDKNHRRNDISKCILHHLFKATNSDDITVNNIDSKGSETIKSLKKLGFEHNVDQFEMIIGMY